MADEAALKKKFSLLLLDTVEKSASSKQLSLIVDILISTLHLLILNHISPEEEPPPGLISDPTSQLRFEHTWEVQSELSAALHADHNKLTHIPKFCEATIGPRKVACIALHTKRLSLVNGGK